MEEILGEAKKGEVIVLAGAGVSAGRPSSFLDGLIAVFKETIH